MTPQEKAFNLYMQIGNVLATNGFVLINDLEKIKILSIVFVDEILKSNPTNLECNEIELNYKFWVDVKNELINL
jgi:hypothetical protein